MTLTRKDFNESQSVRNFIEHDCREVMQFTSEEEIRQMLWRCYIEELAQDCMAEPDIEDILKVVREQLAIPVHTMFIPEDRIPFIRPSALFFGGLTNSLRDSRKDTEENEHV